MVSDVYIGGGLGREIRQGATGIRLSLFRKYNKMMGYGKGEVGNLEQQK